MRNGTNMRVVIQATFRALSTNRFWNTCTAGKGILITVLGATLLNDSDAGLANFLLGEGVP